MIYIFVFLPIFNITNGLKLLGGFLFFKAIIRIHWVTQKLQYRYNLLT